MTNANCEGFPICDNRITERDPCVIKIIGIHWRWWDSWIVKISLNSIINREVIPKKRSSIFERFYHINCLNSCHNIQQWRVGNIRWQIDRTLGICNIFVYLKLYVDSLRLTKSVKEWGGGGEKGHGPHGWSRMILKHLTVTVMVLNLLLSKVLTVLYTTCCLK